jgi:hypothetical protein
MYPKLHGYDLQQLKDLVERNGWKNVQLSLDDIRSASDSAAQQKRAVDGGDADEFEEVLAQLDPHVSEYIRETRRR